ncbi:hypothetical protein GCM10020219_043180 [Nonomuraea dietziae]
MAKEGLWTVGELAAELEAPAYDDPFDRLAQALGGALGGEGRAAIPRLMIRRARLAEADGLTASVDTTVVGTSQTLKHIMSSAWRGR